MAKARSKKRRAPSKKSKAKRSKRAKQAPAQHGGARDGAGRPRDRLPQDVIDRLKAPPSDPVGLRTWNAKLLAEVQWLCIKGDIGSELAATLRANAGSIDRALPSDPRGGRGGDGDDDDIDDDDDEDEDDDGPPLKEVAGGGALRIS